MPTATGPYANTTVRSDIRIRPGNRIGRQEEFVRLAIVPDLFPDQIALFPVAEIFPVKDKPLFRFPEGQIARGGKHPFCRSWRISPARRNNWFGLLSGTRRTEEHPKKRYESLSFH